MRPCFSLVAVLVLSPLAAGVVIVQGQGRRAAPAGPSTELKQSAYIKASNAEAYDHFACGGGNQGHSGDSVAISGDGNTMAVGARYERGGSRGINGNQNDNSAYASGAVYVFSRQGDTWVQQAYVKASNAEQGDHFGSSVALSRDGNTLVVAAQWESSAATGINGNQSDNSIPQAGAVYVFTRTGNIWAQQAYVKASNTGKPAIGDEPGDGDQFGYSVAINDDGGTIAVGAHVEDSSARTINGKQADDSVPSSGAVYIFTLTGSTWAQQAYLKSSNSEQGDMFGFSVALSADGNTLVASAFDERGSGRGVNPAHDNLANGAGAVYVFTRTGGAWNEQAYLKGSKNEGTDQMGYSVAISDDGNTIAAGAGDEDCLTPGVNPAGCDADSPPRGFANIWVGAAYVFVRTGSTWTEQAFIKASNPRPYNSFGVKLALSGDGATLAVSAYLQDDASPGIHGPQLLPFLIVDHLDPWRGRETQAEESGAAYLYTRSSATWTQRAYIKSSNNESGDEFGSAVALSGDGRIMAIGAHNEDGGSRGLNGNQSDNEATNSGAVYIFTN